MTAPPLEQKQHNEAALKHSHRERRHNLPAIGFPGGARPELDAAPWRKVALADPPTLHLPPVEFRRCVFDRRGFDVTCLFTVEDAGRDGRRYSASLEHGEPWPAAACPVKIAIPAGTDRRVGPGRDPVQSIAGLI